MKRTILTMFVLGTMVGFLPPATAQENTEAGPALGVARISLTNGDVSMRRGDSGDWVEASVNSPIVEGDTVASGSGSRAEIQLDYSNLIRLDEESEVQLSNLGERNFRVQLFNGRITYSELDGGEADIDIETPQAAIRPQKNGRYEIETRPGETVLQVRRGEAEIFTSEGSEIVKKGRMAIIRGGLDVPVNVRLANAEPRGDWDEWNEKRDDRLSDVESYRYVSSSIVGAGDLDGYGDWRYVSGYGYTWYPRVTVGWSPYRHGRWTWANYYGWTWIGAEPWGWAPYHYGRWWNHPSYGWGWYPGDRHYRHHWRPALVSFFGYGGRGGWSANIGLGFGNVGWVPLAPGEVYHPWYGYRGRGGNVRVNNTIIVDNSVNIYNDYRNARVRNGVTVVDADGFSRGRLDNARTLNRNELAGASVVRGELPVTPTRQAQGTLRSIRTSATSSNQQDVGRRTTFSRDGGRVAARPTSNSFDQQRQDVAASVRQFRTQGASTSTSPRAAVSSSPRENAARNPRMSGSVQSATTTPRRTATSSASDRVGVVERRYGSAEQGDRGSSPRTAPTYSAPDRTNRGDRGDSVRDRSSSRVTTRSDDQSGLQQRNNRIDNGPTLRNSDSSRESAAPSRSNSRVDRSSAPAPRVDRLDSGRSSRVESGPSSSARIPRVSSEASPRASRQQAPSNSPRVSRQSAPQSSPRVSRPSAPAQSRQSAPQASSPRSSAPASSGGGRDDSRGSRGGRR